MTVSIVVDEQLTGFNGCVVGTAAVRWGDGDERQADVSGLLQQPVQGGLVEQTDQECGRAVGFVDEARGLEMRRPASSDVTLDAGGRSH